MERRFTRPRAPTRARMAAQRALWALTKVGVGGMAFAEHVCGRAAPAIPRGAQRVHRRPDGRHRVRQGHPRQGNPLLPGNSRLPLASSAATLRKSQPQDAPRPLSVDMTRRAVCRMPPAALRAAMRRHAAGRLPLGQRAGAARATAGSSLAAAQACVADARSAIQAMDPKKPLAEARALVCPATIALLSQAPLNNGCSPQSRCCKGKPHARL